MAGNGGNERKERESKIKGADMPLISVVIPAYNCSRTLGNTGPFWILTTGGREEN